MDPWEPGVQSSNSENSSPSPMAASIVGGPGLIWSPQLPTPSLLPPKAFPEEARIEGGLLGGQLPERAGLLAHRNERESRADSEN